MANGIPGEENFEWAYDSFADGALSEQLREEAMGPDLLARREEEQTRALDLLYDISKMDEEQLQTLAVLLEAEALSPAEVAAVRRSIDLHDEQTFAEITDRFEVETYIAENRDRVPLFGRFVAQMASGIELTDNQIATARAQIHAERSRGAEAA